MSHENFLYRIPKELYKIFNDISYYNRMLDFFLIKNSFLDSELEFLPDIHSVMEISSDATLLKEKVLLIDSSKYRENIKLPYLDQEQSIIIATNKFPGEESALALDYRADQNYPRVLCSVYDWEINKNQWIVIANTLKGFINILDQKSNKSPKINAAKWGQIRIGVSTFKDVKCFPGGVREWDWTESGTKHVPGIQMKDIFELLVNGSEVIILSTGYEDKLQVLEQTKIGLEKLGVSYYIGNTELAIRKYNELSDSKKVGGLFHSTC